MDTPKRQLQEIIAAGQRLRQQGLVQAHSGNISQRLEQGFLITASGVGKGSLAATDVLRLNQQGQVMDTGAEAKSPSSEAGLHLALYAARADIAAIVHAHPPYATALASAGKRLDWQLLEEGRLFLGPVPLLPPLAAGSAELAQAAAREALHTAELPEHKANALLLAGHGAVSWGDTLEQALCRMEIIEHIARVMLYQQIFAGCTEHV